MVFPDFPSVENYLDSLINYEQTFPLGGARDRPKLEPTLKAAERLGLSLGLPNCVHIAGTKGKGSVVSYLECLLSREHRVLSFTSPHLVSVKERVRLNGEVLDDSVWQRGFGTIASALQREPAIKLTYFESVWVFYLWAARELKSEVNVVEAGLGGKWDATNVLEDTLAVLTLVDYDHTEILGNTLTEIATDKSGIIKRNARVIIGKQPDEALAVYRARAAEEHAHAQFFGGDFRWTPDGGRRFRYEDTSGAIDDLSLSAPGLHQWDNASIAVRTARTLFPGLSASSIRDRLTHCTIPGRQQLLSGKPDVLVDVAHNPVSFKALAETLRNQYAGRMVLAVIGMARNKDARGSLETLCGLVDEILIVELKNPRTFKQQDLAEIAVSLGFNVRTPASPEAAFAEVHSSRCELGLVVGSFYLAGDYLIWRQRAGIA